MGTNSTKKFLKHANGAAAEEYALTTSAGAGDAHRIPALNTNGVLDATILNAKSSSAGAADAGKTVVLGADGKIDSTMFSASGNADSQDMQASEALVAGDWVNIHNVSNAFRVRKADATTDGKHAMGFVLQGVAANGTVKVYFEGVNTGVTGMVPGDVYLTNTPGVGSATPPNGSGNVVQNIGVAISATAVSFSVHPRIVLA